MDNRLKPSTLFHFTGKEEYLLSILRNGYQPRYCLEYFPWHGNDYFASFAMTCFCEIPLSRIGAHIGRYGGFGIGMSREWAVSKLLAPIAYCPSEGSMFSDAIAQLINSIETKDNPNRNEQIKAVSKLLRHYKPMSGPQISRTEDNKLQVEERTDFSEECEWRHLPIVEESSLGKSIRGTIGDWNMEDIAHLDSEKNRQNESNRAEVLTFAESDIRYIFVPSEAHVEKMHRELMLQNTLLPSRSDRISLTTKITPLDRLAQDI